MTPYRFKQLRKQVPPPTREHNSGNRPPYASQSELAEILGVSARAVQHWEQGTRAVPGIAAKYLEGLARGDGHATGDAK